MPEIITRDAWDAQFGRGYKTDGAKTHFVVHHDGIDRLTPQSTLEDEIAVWRMFEQFHASDLTAANPRIAYTWGVMPFSGRIFEGTGWEHVGAHTHGMNSSAYAVCLPMHGGKTRPSQAAIDAVHWLRAEGVKLGHLTANHILCGHQDHGKPSCPGKLVYDAIVRAAPLSPAVPTIRDMVASHPTLRLGKGGKMARPSEEQAVRVLQRRLRELGELRPQHVTGYFGETTDAAVRRMQRRYYLTVDGIVGPQTYRALGI